MKNTIRLFGNLTRASRRLAKVPLVIVALVAIIGFSMAACPYRLVPHIERYDPPATPTNVSALAVSSTSITVYWRAVDDATEYHVHRSSSASGPSTGGGGTGSSNGGPIPTSWTDTGLTPGTTYYYRVDAGNMNGTSAQSSAVSATTFELSIPTAPTGVSAKAASARSIVVTWNAMSDADGYHVYRSSNGSSYELVGSPTSAYYGDGDLWQGTYSYKVAAYNSKGIGPQSSAVNVTLY